MLIVHFTTVHSRSDTRIRLKEIASVSECGLGEVGLFVQDGLKDCEESERISVIDTGPIKGGRLIRATVGAFRIYRAVKKARPRIAHFHDPELMLVGLALRISGIKVLYDVHEHVPKQILAKQWLPRLLRWPIAKLVSALERFCTTFFNGIIAATPAIAQRFPAHKTITVQNFPLLTELTAPEAVPYQERAPDFTYVGGITFARGAREMVNAMDQLSNEHSKLQLAGKINPKEEERVVQQLPGWSRVNFHGWADRLMVAQIFGQVRAGLVLFHPAPNHIDAQPNKLFEYMAASLPVIASDFPLWRNIVQGERCGLLVDPLDPTSIAEAMMWVLNNPEEAEAMGQRGRQAVENTYNWKPESDKLINFYSHLVGSGAAKE